MKIINEMAYSRKDAIDRCANLGNQFINHFHKIYAIDIDNNTKEHHASEMQGWINDISKIKLSYNNKSLNEKNIYDWFITCGSTISNLFDAEEEAIKYEEFSEYLLDYFNRNVLKSLIECELIKNKS